MEALTLLHDGGAYETACNLLKPSEEQHSPAAVLARAIARAAEVGAQVETAYTTGPSEDELLQRLSNWNESVSPAT